MVCDGTMSRCLDEQRHLLYNHWVDNEDLARQQRAIIAEIERINRVVEPLIRRRGSLARKAAAIHELMTPLDPEPPELFEAQWAAGPEPRDPAEARSRYVFQVPLFGKQRDTLDLSGTFLVGGGADASGDASAIIAEILTNADRPLHKIEILQRSRKHPKGPLNPSTLSTRLSRDREVFERVRPGEHAGYWALRAWPDEKKNADVPTIGREYSEAIDRLVRERVREAHLLQDLAMTERHLAELRIAEAGGGVPPEAQALAERQMHHMDIVRFELRRKAAVISSLREAAVKARDALGEEAAMYPPLPPVDSPPDLGLSPGQDNEPLPIFEGAGADQRGDEP